MTISYWESREAMSSFTGDDPTRIHHLERDAEFLIELPKACRSSTCARATAGQAGVRNDADPRRPPRVLVTN